MARQTVRRCAIVLGLRALTRWPAIVVERSVTTAMTSVEWS